MFASGGSPAGSSRGEREALNRIGRAHLLFLDRQGFGNPAAPPT
jgi:hypothetical protein